MAVVTKEDTALEALRASLRGERSDQVEVIDVRTEYLLDSYAEECVAVTLILNDPAPGLYTWPLDNVHELLDRAHEVAATLPIPTRVVVDVNARPDYDDLGGNR